MNFVNMLWKRFNEEILKQKQTIFERLYCLGFEFPHALIDWILSFTCWNWRFFSNQQFSRDNALTEIRQGTLEKLKGISQLSANSWHSIFSY